MWCWTLFVFTVADFWQGQQNCLYPLSVYGNKYAQLRNFKVLYLILFSILFSILHVVVIYGLMLFFFFERLPLAISHQPFICLCPLEWCDLSPPGALHMAWLSGWGILLVAVQRPHVDRLNIYFCNCCSTAYYLFKIYLKLPRGDCVMKTIYSNSWSLFISLFTFARH